MIKKYERFTAYKIESTVPGELKFIDWTNDAIFILNKNYGYDLLKIQQLVQSNKSTCSIHRFENVKIWIPDNKSIRTNDSTNINLAFASRNILVNDYECSFIKNERVFPLIYTNLVSLDKIEETSELIIEYTYYEFEISDIKNQDGFDTKILNLQFTSNNLTYKKYKVKNQEDDIDPNRLFDNVFFKNDEYSIRLKTDTFGNIKFTMRNLLNPKFGNSYVEKEIYKVIIIIASKFCEFIAIKPVPSPKFKTKLSFENLIVLDCKCSDDSPNIIDTIGGEAAYWNGSVIIDVFVYTMNGVNDENLRFIER